MRADGTGRVRLDDGDAPAGAHVGYRLVRNDGGTPVLLAETWLDLPARAGLWLAGARPNPSPDGLAVAFSLEHRGPATLAVYDVAGRHVASRDLSALEPGEHVMRVADAGALPPGQASDVEAWHGSVRRIRALDPERVHFCHHTDIIHR